MFQPSPYQQRIFDFIEHEHGNGFIRASAGSGKTTTLIKALEHVPPYLQALFLAFNRSVSDTLKSRIPANATAMGIHQFGLSTLMRQFPRVGTKQYKYYEIAEEVVKENWKTNFPVSKYYLRNLILDYVHYAQVTLTDPNNHDAMFELARYYGISTQFKQDAFRWAAEVMLHGYRQTFATGEVSFNDMLWLPNIIPMMSQQYDIVLVDEAQDLSRAQRELVLKAVKPGGRIVFVLDPKQAVYSFLGADADSISALRELPMMEEMPLSICYRCPRSHIELARTNVPDIEPAPWAIEGQIHHISADHVVQAVRPGDLVMCRTNAPLYRLCLELLDAGVPAKLQGKDIVKEFSALTSYVETYEKKHPRSSIADGCKAFAEARIAELQEFENVDLQVDMVRDQAEVIISIAAKRGLLRIKDVVAVLKELTTDQPNPVLLASIHRSKGLEAERTFILHPELLPHPKATSDHAKEQEMNLLHIALTRSKSELTFVESIEKKATANY